MNLRDLHYLVSVADLRSFIQASEHCHISQPTLSMQIKKMEDDLGVQIFERTNKKVLPTELGEQIIDAARRILNEVDLIKELAKTSQEPLAGNLRLGGFPTLATYIFPQLVPLINQELPRIRLILVEEKTELLIQQLKSGQLDVALLAVPIADDFLESEARWQCAAGSGNFSHTSERGLDSVANLGMRSFTARKRTNVIETRSSHQDNKAYFMLTSSSCANS